ncbi:MAG TPA: type II secretion system F family protein [Burkholderiales bacterium]|nr:type II secretion system F family protein [Burkholderiales bacterium]
MPAFQYKAIDQTGHHARGRLDAANEGDLELRLKRMGLDLINCRRFQQRSIGAGRVSRRDLINLCFDLEQMTRAGIPLIDGLRDLRDSIDNPRLREILTSLTEDMEGGKLLSQCLAAHPHVFNNVFVSLVRAGEQAGRLPEGFESLGSALKWQDELASQTQRLLAYPMMVLVVVTAVMLFLLIYLVPQVVGLLKNLGLALPLQTRILIWLSGAVSHYWPLVFGLPLIAVGVSVIAVRNSARARYFWDGLKLRLPVTGPIIQKIILSRFASFFALMYQSGITVLDALKTSEEIAGNRVIAEGLAQVGRQVSAGDTLTETFQASGLFPPLVIRMLRVGETTGALDTALLNVSYFYTRDVRESVDKALRLLEPTLTLLLGGMLALVMWSVLTPVYNIIGQLKF